MTGFDSSVDLFINLFKSFTKYGRAPATGPTSVVPNWIHVQITAWAVFC